MSGKKLAIISIILAAISVGISLVFVKIAVKHIPPFTFIFFRFLIASLLVTPFLLRQRTQLLKPSLKVIGLSLIQTTNTIFTTIGIKFTTATISQTLFSATPILSVILSYWIIKEYIGFRKVNGVIVGFIGTVIIIFLPVLGKQSGFNGSLLGNILVFISPICLATYSVLSKKFHYRYSPLYLTALFFYITTAVAAMLALTEFATYPEWWQTVVMLTWTSVFFAGVTGAIFFLLYQYSVKHGSPVIASTSLYIAPIVTFLISSIILGERLTLGFLFGASLALVGVFIVTTSKN